MGGEAALATALVVRGARSCRHFNESGQAAKTTATTASTTTTTTTDEEEEEEGLHVLFVGGLSDNVAIQLHRTSSAHVGAWQVVRSRRLNVLDRLDIDPVCTRPLLLEIERSREIKRER